MKHLFFALIISTQAQAIICETDQECFNASLRLVKQAIKLNACQSESKALLSSLDDILNDKGQLNALELCLHRAKKTQRTSKSLKAKQDKIAELKASL